MPHTMWWGQKDKDFRDQGCLASSLFSIQSWDFSPTLVPSLRVGWCSESSPSSLGSLRPPHPFSRCAADCREGGGGDPGGGEADTTSGGREQCCKEFSINCAPDASQGQKVP